MKTRLTKNVVSNMGLKIVNGVYVDKYGRTFETFIDKDGYNDIKPNGTIRNMHDYYRA